MNKVITKKEICIINNIKMSRVNHNFEFCSKTKAENNIALRDMYL